MPFEIRAPWLLCTLVACSTGSDGLDPLDPGGALPGTGPTTAGQSSSGPTTGGAPAPTTLGSGSESGSESTDARGSSSTGEAGIEACLPTLGAEAAAWKAEYDVFFADTDSMRRYLDDIDAGGGHWSQTYTLRGLGLMFELTGETAYLDELIYQGDRVIAAATDSTWPTGVCGNTFLHSTLVIDALMLYPLLRAGWWIANSRLAQDPVYADVPSTWTEFAAAALAGHEADHRTTGDESYYVFPDSYSCVAGDVMPFNYANAAGKTYAALYRLTGDDEARARAEALHRFWWNRTYRHEPSPTSSVSRWWGYRGVVDEPFDPTAYPGDDRHRPEDLGHGDHSSDFAGVVHALGLDGQDAASIDEVALSSKRWIDRALSLGGAPAEFITNAEQDGEWVDAYDHLPMACYRSSILADLAARAATDLTDASGDYRRAHSENLAELAFYSEYAGTDPACAPTCGDGWCSGPEDCVQCPADCGACPVTCD